MTGLERVMTAVTGSDADHQPFTMLLSLYGAGIIKCNTAEYYRNPALWYEGQKAVIDLLDPDILITPFSFPLEAEAFGSEVVFLPNFSPNLKKPFITDLSQVRDICLPDTGSSKSLQFFLESTRMMARDFKETRAIASVLLSPCDLPALLMGIEMWIDTLLFHPAETDAVLQKTIEHFVCLGNEYLANGASFLVVPVNFTNPMIITNRILEKLMPYLVRAFRRLNGPVVIHNGGCKIMPFISNFATLPNVIAILPEHRESFDEARTIVGDKMVLMGNLDGPCIANLTPDEASAATLRILENRKDDRHFIFATSNGDIPYDTPAETLVAVARTIRGFKKF
ncbi:MAG: uroporphyrinogen decarboxylase family protein [Methanosarcina sp.]